jgi:hypothetical protein
LRASGAAAAAAQLEIAARTGHSAQLSALADKLTAEVRGAIVSLEAKLAR